MDLLYNWQFLEELTDWGVRGEDPSLLPQDRFQHFPRNHTKIPT
jgi:hypothetical protein